MLTCRRCPWAGLNGIEALLNGKFHIKFHTVKIGTNSLQRVKNWYQYVTFFIPIYLTFCEICAHSEIICSIHIIFFDIYIWAVTCDFQLCGILTSVDSDVPVQPPFKLKTSKWCSLSSFDTHRIFKGLAKALIRLPVCAGWSETLLVAHTTLLEISCPGSYMNGVSFEILGCSSAPIWLPSYPHLFCFQWITCSELSIQLLNLKCMIKMEKDGLYISALDNAKTVVQQL